MKLSWSGAWKFFTRVTSPIAKSMMIGIVQMGGDVVQSGLEEEVAKNGLKGVDKLVDKFQAKALAAIAKLGWVPAWLREGTRKIIQDEVDGFQTILRKALKREGPEVIGKVFDVSQKSIIQRIRAL